MPAPLHPDEPFRIRALHRLRVLDSEPEPAFDQITQLAARLYNAPMATITMVDANRQWFKACVGMGGRETGRDLAFCAFTILQSESLVVLNALEDSRFSTYGNVLGPPHIRFYAGAPIVTRDGFTVGTLCVIDSVSRTARDVDTGPLQTLAGVVAELLELRSLSTTLCAPSPTSDLSYSAIIADLRDVIFLLDASFRFTFVNPAWTAVTGYELKDTLGRTPFDFIHPDDRDEARQQWNRLATTLQPFSAVRRFLDAFGRPIWASVFARAETSSGVFNGATGTLHNLTEQKKAELLLSAERERLQKTLDTAADAFVALTDTGIVTSWNEAAEKLFGFRREDVIGKEMASFLVPEPLREAHRKGIAHYRSTRKPTVSGSPIELTALHASGAEIPVEITIWPMNIGGELSFQAFLKDISVRRRIAESLEQARLSAEQASRAKSAFVASISHEIRTPLNALLGMAEVLASTPLSHEQSRYLQTMQRAGGDLLALINSVLDLSKVESGQLLLEYVDFNLRDVAARTLDIVRMRLHAGVLLESLIQPSVPDVVNGDPVRFQQVLTNLLANAAKFTHAGSIQLCIDNHQAANPYELTCKVIDTGIGIPESKLEAIFEDFAQVDASTTRKYGGTGLGLGIAKRLVELMGGRIAVSSAPGQGSTFRFSVQFSQPEVQAPTAPPPSPRTVATHTCSILIADDNPDNRFLLEIYLKDSGHAITYANDGSEAIAAWEKSTFDLVLMDMQMPVLDGLEATRRIRAAEAAAGRNRTPIVALTANALSSDLEATARAGADAHLTKPFTKQALLDTVAACLNQKPPHRVVMPQGLEAICPNYLAKRKADIPRLLEWVRTGNFQDLESLAHDLKGTGGAYGFPEITAQAELIEQASRAHDVERLSAQINQLGAYLESVELVPSAPA